MNVGSFFALFLNNDGICCKRFQISFFYLYRNYVYNNLLTRDDQKFTEKQGGRKMSIKEIAKRAQVSPATVSRVLNNPDYKCSSPQIRGRIRKAAIELNYVPNEAARRLKTGSSTPEEKTYYINILMTRADSAHIDPFFEELLRVVETEIHRNNCILSQVWYKAVFSSDKRCRRENVSGIIDKMYEKTEGRCDGLIIVGKCNKEALALLQKKYKNVVCVNRNGSYGMVDEVV